VIGVRVGLTYYCQPSRRHSPPPLDGILRRAYLLSTIPTAFSAPFSKGITALVLHHPWPNKLNIPTKFDPSSISQVLDLDLSSPGGSYLELWSSNLVDCFGSAFTQTGMSKFTTSHALLFDFRTRDTVADILSGRQTDLQNQCSRSTEADWRLRAALRMCSSVGLPCRVTKLDTTAKKRQIAQTGLAVPSIRGSLCCMANASTRYAHISADSHASS
jgi:hypothetical protein